MHPRPVLRVALLFVLAARGGLRHRRARGTTETPRPSALRGGEMVEAARLESGRRTRRVAGDRRAPATCWARGPQWQAVLLRRHVRQSRRRGLRARLSRAAADAVSHRARHRPQARDPGTRHRLLRAAAAWCARAQRGIRHAPVPAARGPADRRSRQRDPRAQGQARARPARGQQGRALLQSRGFPGSPGLAGHEIVWIDNALDAFMLEVQGSGRVQLLPARPSGCSTPTRMAIPIAPSDGISRTRAS